MFDGIISNSLIGSNKSVIFFVLAVCLLSASVYPASAQGETIRVGVDQYQPVLFVDDDGVASGFAIDILEHIALQEGWTLEYVPITWEEGLEKLENNEIDLLMDVAYSETRDEVYDYSTESVVMDWGAGLYTPGFGNKFSLCSGSKNRCVSRG